MLPSLASFSWRFSVVDELCLWIEARARALSSLLTLIN